MSKSKQSCTSQASQLGIDPTVMLMIARLLGGSKPVTVADSITGSVCAHIVELSSDPKRASSWSRFLYLATLSSRRQMGSKQARELSALIKELRYVTAEQSAREELKSEA